MPPDWYYEEKKREEKREWNDYRGSSAALNTDTGAEYHKERAKAFKQYIDEVVGRHAYEETVRMFQQFRSATLNPGAAREAALRDANRRYEPGFTFPDQNAWAAKNASTWLAEGAER